MPRLLHDWLTEQARQRPEATAVVLEPERLTYGELETYSSRLSGALRAVGCQPGDRVALLLPKSPLAVAAILGVLKADAIYVPLDLGSPAPRVARQLSSCQPRCVLATAAALPLLDQLFDRLDLVQPFVVGWLDSEAPGVGRHRLAFTGRDLEHFPGAPAPSRNTPQDAAYILFTSGSTGDPKGVVITHANVTAFVEWATTYFQLGPGDRLSGHSPLHFDLSVFDIFGALAAGAELHLVPDHLRLDAHRLAGFIRTAQLTQWFSVPSALSYMAQFDVVRPDDFPTLKRVLWCGDVLPMPVLRYWMRRLPHVTFTNLYGPTEATIASSYYTVPACPPDDVAAVPIGVPCPGEELLVLDEHLKPVPPGDIGHLYIRGVGLSPGYWQDEERTRAAFIPNPFGSDPRDRLYRTGDLARIGPDGLVYFVGRTDTQVKSRGYRIELGEVEAALRTMPGLRDCAVVGMPTTGFEGTVICCAYVPVPGAAIAPAILRRELARLLPSYMLPARWIALERLPINANGKVDRPALKALFATHDAPAPH
jgi:amino acid adenylation domain-containing protein